MPAVVVSVPVEGVTVNVKTLSKSAADGFNGVLREKEALFSSLDEKIGHLDLPTLAHCAVHLQLLNAFAVLKSRVLQSEWTQSFGLEPEQAWRQYVQLAVARFTIWTRSVTPLQMAASLPPIDVMLVWHSFMLNPSTYSKFSRAGGYEGIQWALVHEAIDVESGTLSLSGSDKAIAESINLHPDLLAFLNGQKNWVPTSQVSANSDEKEKQLLKVYSDMANSNFIYRKLDFDATAAVHRQGRFVDKMFRYGWLQSPTVVPLLRAAVDRYVKFFALIAKVRSGIVPTIDVDLVWHTHQLSPSHYAAFCTARTGRFINHDDSDKPSSATRRVDTYKRTRQTYRDVFAADYHVCLSWYCVAARGSQPGSAARLSPENRATLDAWVDGEQKRRAKARLEKMDLARCQCFIRKTAAIPVTSLDGADCGAPPPCSSEPPMFTSLGSADCESEPPPTCVAPPMFISGAADCGADPPPCSIGPPMFISGAADCGADPPPTSTGPPMFISGAADCGADPPPCSAGPPMFISGAADCGADPPPCSTGPPMFASLDGPKVLRNVPLCPGNSRSCLTMKPGQNDAEANRCFLQV